MSSPQNICVADTSVLIALTKGGVLECLGGLFEKIYIPEAVQNECRDMQTAVAIQQPFFQVVQVKRALNIPNIDRGELEAISLAVSFDIPVLLIDDKKAVRKAVEYELEVLSFDEILILAKYAELIESVKRALDKMKAQKEGIPDREYFRILKEAGEF